MIPFDLEWSKIFEARVQVNCGLLNFRSFLRRRRRRIVGNHRVSVSMRGKESNGNYFRCSGCLVSAAGELTFNLDHHFATLSGNGWGKARLRRAALTTVVSTSDESATDSQQFAPLAFQYTQAIMGSENYGVFEIWLIIMKESLFCSFLSCETKRMIISHDAFLQAVSNQNI